MTADLTKILPRSENSIFLVTKRPIIIAYKTATILASVLVKIPEKIPPNIIIGINNAKEEFRNEVIIIFKFALFSAL